MLGPRTFAALLVLLGSGVPGCAAPHQPAQQSPTRSTSVAGGDAPYLAEATKAAALAGGSPLELLASGAGIPGDSVSAFVFVPAGRCALVVARGGADIEDLDLYLFADDGDELAASEDASLPATLLRCAEDGPERFLAVARLAAGRGPFALGLVDAPKAKAKALEERFSLARAGASGRAEDYAGLDEALSAHRDVLGANWRDLRRVLVPVDHRVPAQLDFVVEQERCVDAFVLPGSGAIDIDVEALSESGRIVARAEARGHERALLVCAGAAPSRVTLRLRPHAGRGTALVSLSRTTHLSDRRDLHPEFPRHDLSPAPGAPPKLAPGAKRLNLSVEGVVVQALSWTGCKRLELEPRWPLLGYRLSAYDGEGRLVGEHDGKGPGVLHLCLPKAGGTPGQLQLRATSRGGPLDLQSRAEATPAADLLGRFPLATSRLLGLASDLGVLQEVADIGQVSPHEIGPDQLARIPLLVPAERCLTVLAAVESSGRGIELGLVDSTTARFVDFARGARVAWVRACAERGRTEDLVVEVRAPYGETVALLSTRQEPLRRPNVALLR